MYHIKGVIYCVNVVSIEYNDPQSELKIKFVDKDNHGKTFEVEWFMVMKRGFYSFMLP